MAQRQLQEEVNELSSSIESLMASTDKTMESLNPEEKVDAAILASGISKEWTELGPEMKQIYGNIVGIRNKLNQMVQSSRPHAMDDLRTYQQILDSIDCRRDEGIFGGSLKSGHIPAGQAVCREVLDEAYDLLQELVESSQDLDPSILAVQSSLSGILRRLNAFSLNFKAGSEQFTWEDLRHYEQMLNSIDRKREDGIFCGSTKTRIPEGQAACSDLLSKCFDTLEDLKQNAVSMNPAMLAIHDKLLGFRETLREMKKSPDLYDMSDVMEIEDDIDSLEQAQMADVFGQGRGDSPPGQHVIKSLLKECRKLLRQLERYFVQVSYLGRHRAMKLMVRIDPQHKAEDWNRMDKAMKHQFSQLSRIRNHLLSAQMKEIDLNEKDREWFERKLNSIDSQRRKSALAFKKRPHGMPAGIASCQKVIDEAFAILSKIVHPEASVDGRSAASLHAELARIKRSIGHQVETGETTKEEMDYFEKRLSAIGGTKFRVPVSGEPEVYHASSEVRCCARILEECDALLADLKNLKPSGMDPALKYIFQKLEGIKEVLAVYSHMARDQIPKRDIQELVKQFECVQREKDSMAGKDLTGFDTLEEMVKEISEGINGMKQKAGHS